MGYGYTKFGQIQMTAGTSLLGSNNSQTDTLTNDTYALIKSIPILCDVSPTATLNFYWEVASWGGNNMSTSCRIYLNGVAVSTELTGCGGWLSFNPYTVNVSFTNLKIRDNFELWAKALSPGATNTYRIEDFRIFGGAIYSPLGSV